MRRKRKLRRHERPMPEHLLPTVRRTFVDGTFGQVHCRICTPDTVTRPPLVLLHMSPKSSLSFRALMPLLAHERVVLAPDNPGHGESDLPPAEPPVTVADFATSAWSAIRTLVAGPVHLAGYHTGSMVAVEAAVQNPTDVLSIINVSAPIFTAAERTRLDEEYSPLPLDESGSRFTIMWQRVLDNRGPGVPLEVCARSFGENLRAGEDYEWGHRAAFAYSATYNERLPALAHPMRVMNPHDDCYEQTLRIRELAPDIELIDYPAHGHGFLDIDPAPFAARITEFIERHDP